MGYHHQTNPYQQGNVQGGQPQDTGYNNQRTSRSHSQPSVQTGDSLTLNRSLSTNRAPVSGQAQPFEAYRTGQNREPGLQYVPSTNTPQYIGAQGQIQSSSYQDPSQAYQSTEQYFPLEGQPPHLVSQQNRSHQSPPQQPSVPHNPPHSVQGQYPQFQRGDVDHSAGHLQQRRPSSSQYPQQQQQQQQRGDVEHSAGHLQQRQSSASQYPQQQQQRRDVEHSAGHLQQRRSPASQYPQQQQQQHQPSTQPYSQQPQSSPPQYQQQQQQPSTQPYSQHQQSSPPQQRRQYQPSSQQYAQQQQTSPPLRQQGNFATAPGNAASSFGPNVPGENYGAPGEEIRQSRSMHRSTTQAGPFCRLSNCRNPAIRDGATQELTEYCSLDHMQEDAQRGAPRCPACNKCPRRINGKYCGTSCERYDKERLQQPRQQQQHHPRPPSGVRPHLSAPSPSGNVTWGTAPGESSPAGNFAPDNQHLLPAGGLVRCPKCNTTYSARGRSHPRGGQGSPVDYASLPPCPMCGFSR